MVDGAVVVVEDRLIVVGSVGEVGIGDGSVNGTMKTVNVTVYVIW